MSNRRVDWQKLRQEYIANPTTTYKLLSTKYVVPLRSVAWHGQREKWPLGRANYCIRVDTKLLLDSAIQAASTVAELNDQHLRRSAELRELLDSRLGTRNGAGELVPREELTIAEIAKAVLAYGWLYRMDRLALGADVAQPPTPRDRFAEMSDEELMEELRKVRARNIVH
jgi:hypothetical protein